MVLEIEKQSRSRGELRAAVEAAAERAITALINRSARLADDQKFMEWIELFTEDGVYSGITLENRNEAGLYLFKDVGRRALHMRAAWLMGLWQAPRGKTVHLVSNIEVTLDDDGAGADCVSNYIVTRTADMAHSKLHACGRYYDRFVKVGGDWLFASREVVVDSNLLPAEFTELL